MIAGIQRLARGASDWAGRESVVVRFLRPLYEAGLWALTGGRGVPLTLNGLETFRIDPRYRREFPATYEPAVFTHLRASLHEGAVVLDVGANVGIHALCLARRVGASGHVYAFEPNPPARAVMARHLKLNNLEERVTVEAAAVADRVGKAPLFTSGVNGMSRLGEENPLLRRTRAVTVPVTTIDAFCTERSIVPDLVLIDIEGYEAAALYGARATIAALHGRLGIVVELHPSAWDASGWPRARFEQLLEELGLTARSLDNRAATLAEYGHVKLVPS